MNHDNLLFYDVEVFEQDALIVIKNYNNEIVGEHWCERANPQQGGNTGFEAVPAEIAGKILVGYNNYSYDDFILERMMNEAVCGWELIKSLSDDLISGKKQQITPKKLHPSLDTFQQISLTYPSLKMIEGNMGKSIIESEIDFNHKGKLTEDEKRIVEKYCEYDVENTIEVFKLREASYFDPKAYLTEMAGENDILRWNTTTIIANILTKDKKIYPWTKHRVQQELLEANWLPGEVKLMWKDMLSSLQNASGKGRTTKVRMYGCEFVFGMGGLHGAPIKPGRYHGVKLADVGSMYPSIIVKLNALGDVTDKYDEIRKERLRIKGTDKVRADALKLILNSTYGLFKNKYSALYNPFAAATVCIYGQIALFKLCKDLADSGYELVNINTDGVAFVDDRKPREKDCDQICKEWEHEFSGLNLDVKEYDTWIQKDVNNYVAEKDGKVKVKGGEVNKYEKDNLFGNNDARIIHIATVDELLHGKLSYKTVAEHLNHPEEFMYVLRPGGKFVGTCYKDGKPLSQKVNRVFAWKKKNEYSEDVKLYKKREDGGTVLYPNAPDNMYLYNGDLSDMTEFKNIINEEHYSNLAHNRVTKGGWPE